MAIAFKGVMQVPATIFKDDYSLDLPAFERMIVAQWHLAFKAVAT